MAVIQSELDVHGDDFARNREAMLAAVASFREVEQKVLDKAQDAKPKFEKRGQLLPRERLNLLLDPGSPSWSCAPWPATSCTTTRTAPRPAAASSPASATSPGCAA